MYPNLLLMTTGLDGGVLAAAMSFSLLPGPPGGLEDNGPQVLPGLVSSPSVPFKHTNIPIIITSNNDSN